MPYVDNNWQLNAYGAALVQAANMLSQGYATEDVIASIIERTGISAYAAHVALNAAMNGGLGETLEGEVPALNTLQPSRAFPRGQVWFRVNVWCMALPPSPKRGQRGSRETPRGGWVGVVDSVDEGEWTGTVENFVGAQLAAMGIGADSCPQRNMVIDTVYIFRGRS